MIEYDPEKQVEAAYRCLGNIKELRDVKISDVENAVSELHREDFSPLYDKLEELKKDVVRKGLEDIKNLRLQSSASRNHGGSRSMDNFYENGGRVVSTDYRDRQKAINSVLDILKGIEKKLY